MKKKIILLIVFILIIGTLSGCQLNQDEAEKAKEDEGIVVEDIEDVAETGGEIILPLTTFETLNPLITENNSYYYFSKLIFDGLFKFNENLNIEPQLAESYTLGEDGMTVDIKLNSEVKWHDGEPLTSKDILFTINTIKFANSNNIYREMFQNSVGSYRPSDIRRIVDVKIRDDQNLTIVFDRVFSNNLEVLTFPVLASHIFGGLSNAAYAKALEIEEYSPIGTGPFKFEKYEKMKEITLSANEEFRRKRPYIDKVIGRVFESEEAIIQAFETREVTVATTIGVDWDKYTQEDNTRSIDFVSSNYEFLGFNFAKNIFSKDSGVALRKAITYAIDRQGIIEKVYLGHGTQIDVPIHPDSWLLSDEANQYGYNLDKAKEQLKQAGLTDKNDEGILIIDGNEVALKLLTNTFNPLRLKTANLIKEDLKKIGIKVIIFPETDEEKEEYTQEEIETQWEKINAEIINGKYDIVLSGLQLSAIPDLSFAFHSSQTRSMNFINYSNPKMDLLLEKSFVNKSRDAKKEAYKELQALIVEDVPYSSLLFKNKSLLLDSKIKGDIEPSFFNPYNGLENAYIPKDLQ